MTTVFAARACLLEGRRETRGRAMAYTIQGNTVNIDAEPQIRDGRTYVPLRDFVQELGGAVAWDNQSKVAAATIGKWVATVRPDNTHVDVSGIAVTLNAVPFLDEDDTL